MQCKYFFRMDEGLPKAPLCCILVEVDRTSLVRLCVFINRPSARPAASVHSTPILTKHGRYSPGHSGVPLRR